MNAATLQGKDNPTAPRLYMARELSTLSNGGWCLGMVARRRVTVEAGYREQLREAVAKAKEKFGLPGDIRVVSCYEAGRDGFWLIALRQYLEYGLLPSGAKLKAA